MSRALILLPTNTYRAADVLATARRMGVDVVVGSDRAQVLESATDGTTLTFPFDSRNLPGAVAQAHRRRPFHGVVGLDDETVASAARIAAWLGLAGNDPTAVEAGRSKLGARNRLQAAGLRGPRFWSMPCGEVAARATEIAYPCVAKPTYLSASRGVIRADTPTELVAASERIASILQDVPPPEGLESQGDTLLIEEFLAGAEYAVDGHLLEGRFCPLLVFAKPDPLDGPFFEETLYVTPPSLPAAVEARVLREVESGARALGYVHGPIHAELRLRDGTPTLLEVAPRPIGGLCPRVVPLAIGIAVEEVALRIALDLPLPEFNRVQPAGVMMLPIPRAGTLQAVAGVAEAEAVPGIHAISISIGVGQEVVPLPEGNRYLGFIFATGEDPARVETALREAHACLAFEID